jgi:nucleoside-diphosphate-sugar epimerase
LTHRGSGEEWIDESLPPQPCLLARGHLEMEAQLKQMHRDQGLRVVILSPGFVYGAGGFLKLTCEMLLAGRYRIMGKGDNYWSLVHIDDLGEAYALALERGRAGESYFLADNQPLRRKDVIYLVADSLGLPRPGHVPNWLMRLYLGSALVEAANASIRLRNDKAKMDLGWSPKLATLEQGLQHIKE